MINKIDYDRLNTSSRIFIRDMLKEIFTELKYIDIMQAQKTDERIFICCIANNDEMMIEKEVKIIYGCIFYDDRKVYFYDKELDDKLIDKIEKMSNDELKELFKYQSSRAYFGILPFDFEEVDNIEYEVETEDDENDY